MDKQFVHRVRAWWTSGHTGIAVSDSAPTAIHFTAPPNFYGIEGRWTPEDLLLSAIASCFVTTFFALASYASFKYTDFEVEAEGAFSKVDSGYKFREIVLRPRLQVEREEDEVAALKLFENAKLLCLISRAILTPIRVEVRVTVGKKMAAYTA